MKAVAYCHPFVPSEWIAAHGLRPCWLPCRGDEPAAWVRRGTCPVAGGLLDEFREDPPADAVVLTTTCDQVRYAAAMLQHRGKLPVFLLNVPRTWQTAAVRALYRDELARLGRFLVECGGSAPTDAGLSQTMLRYDRARASLRSRCGEMSAAAYAEAIAAVRGHLAEAVPVGPAGWISESVQSLTRAREAHPAETGAVGCCASSGVGEKRQVGNLPHAPCLSLALVGGPMSRGDYQLLAAVEEAGGRFVLDATEAGERTLAAPVDIDRLQTDPLEELVRIYFDCIPDVFQRPNDRLFAWLRRHLAQRRVRGILVRRHVWCDHWHGELPRLREELGLPLLEWDGGGNDPRALGRMEAFLEMLR